MTITYQPCRDYTYRLVDGTTVIREVLEEDYHDMVDGEDE